MASIAATLLARLRPFAIAPDVVSLETLLLDHSLNGSDAYAAPQRTALERAVLDQLETVLAMPDVSEGDQSIKYDRAAISRYVASLRVKLDPPAPLPTTNKVKSISNRW